MRVSAGEEMGEWFMVMCDRFLSPFLYRFLDRLAQYQGCSLPSSRWKEEATTKRLSPCAIPLNTTQIEWKG